MKKTISFIFALSTCMFALSAQAEPRICTMQYAIMIHPETLECKAAHNGCVIEELLQQGYRMAKSGECGKNQAQLVNFFAPQDNLSIELQQQMKDIDQEVQSEISDLSCDSTSQCASQAYGNRPCGGPSTYLIYSTKTTNVEKLEGLAQRYTHLHQQYNELNQVISICSYETPPAVACVENTCVESMQ